MLGTDPGLPGAQGRDGLGAGVDPLRLGQSRPAGLSAEKVLLPHLGPGDKHAALLGGVLPEDIQRVLELGQLPLGLRGGAGVPVQEGGVRLIVKILLRLPDLQAPGVEQFGQQGVPVSGKGDEREPFHFDNGH